MQAHYPPSFDREMGCTEAELLQWLPGASNERPVVVRLRQAVVALGEGQLLLTWQTLPPRQIALLRMPRLAVSFRFSGVDDAQRQSFMRYFDLYTQRGGG
jgi:hypothetical protein